jgi:hypothetical protein
MSLFYLFLVAAIQGITLKSAFQLPRRALRDQDSVLIVDSQNRIQIRKVELARVDRDLITITGGLEKGERVCLTPLDFVVEGMEVNTIQQETAAGEMGLVPPDPDSPTEG